MIRLFDSSFASAGTVRAWHVALARDVDQCATFSKRAWQAALAEDAGPGVFLFGLRQSVS